MHRVRSLGLKLEAELRMSENDTRATVDRLYEAFMAGDAEGMLALMDESVEVRFLGQGVFRGIEETRRFMSFAGGLLKDIDFRIKKIIVDGETGCALWEETATTADGHPWENHGVDVIQVSKGRIVSLHENNDVTLVHRHFPRYEDPDMRAGR
jgi:ketosteroid isomerase-like protein